MRLREARTDRQFSTSCRETGTPVIIFGAIYFDHLARVDPDSEAPEEDGLADFPGNCCFS